MKSFFLIFFLIPLYAFSQFFDDFSDGDFTNNPKWNGNTETFIVNSDFQLQLNDTVLGKSALFADIEAENSDLEWHFDIKLNFSPSQNNNAKVYLVSKNDISSNNNQAFYLQFGENGLNDAIELYWQDNNDKQLICRGINGYIANKFDLKIKVLKSRQGVWEIYSADNNGAIFELQTQGNSTKWDNFTCLGALCNYTKSNAKSFYFDNFYFGKQIQDTVKPKIHSINIINNKELKIVFNEKINVYSASNIDNYVVDNDIGKPEFAKVENNLQTITLAFKNSFTDNINYKIDICGVSDIAGNTMIDTSLYISINNIKQFDIVINEIMANPKQMSNLPPYEYIELYNRTEKSINIKDWEINIGSSSRKLPEKIILKNEHIIVIDEKYEDLFKNYGKTIGVKGLNINNVASTITLINSNNQIIHSINYSEDMISEAIKKTGGWSVEQIDYNNPCNEEQNWRVSISSSGGTPCSVNSVSLLNIDNEKPEIEKITFVNNYELKVFFSEKMDSLTLVDNNRYNINNDFGNPVQVTLVSPNYNSVILKFNNKFEENEVYELSLSTELTDCVGNKISGMIAKKISFHKQIAKNDIIINEVLMQPDANGEKFIEIYNKSNKWLDLRELLIGKRDNITNLIGSSKEVAPDGRLIEPYEYVVLTRNPNDIISRYYAPNKSSFVKINPFPQFSADNSNIVIYTTSDIIVDEFSYKADMQFALLTSKSGISLERINPNIETSNSNNWHSASENVGFATPTYKNSQYRDVIADDNLITIEPEIFSPDNDGYNDVLIIKINEVAINSFATIKIYNSNGLLVKSLINNMLLGNENVFMWNGLSDNNKMLNIGIYIINIEIVNANGNVKSYKKSAVLARKI